MGRSVDVPLIGYPRTAGLPAISVHRWRHPHDPLPVPVDVGVGDAAYLNGLAETVGELRRHLLDVLRAGDVARASALFAAMEDIHALLADLDFPDAITGNLRRATDVARSIIERTRSDLTLTVIQRDLADALRGQPPHEEPRP